MKHNTAFFILVSFIMVLAPFSGCGTSNNAIVFPDSYLEDAIRLTLNQPEGAISQEKLTKLTKLDISGWFIRDITGLEYCVNLIDLHCDVNEITDLSPLSTLKKLETLELGASPISDLSPLEECTRLKNLILWDTNISDLTPLANLTGMERLILVYNKIKSLHGLENMVNLTELDLGSNEFSDITPLSSLVSLQILDLGQVRPEVSFPQGDLSSSTLDIKTIKLEALSPLVNLKNLKELYLDARLIEDVSSLASLSGIETLSLRYNEIVDISPLTSLKKLKTLRLDANPITDLEAWSHYIPSQGQSLEIKLEYCPLNEKSVSTYIPAMEEAGIWVSR